jgi:broad specificity phosphatase PhoE
VYSSPLQRALQTARLAGFANPRPNDLLVEWDYGDYEGLTSVEIHGRQPQWDLWQDGCPNGENPPAVLDRAARFLREVFDSTSGPALAFTHGHFARALAVVALELPPPAGARLNLETAALSVLRRENQNASLQLWNDTGHLPGSTP